MNLDLGVLGQFPEEFAGQLLGLLRTRTNTASRRSVELEHYNMVLQHVLLKTEISIHLLQTTVLRFSSRRRFT